MRTAREAPGRGLDPHPEDQFIREFLGTLGASARVRGDVAVAVALCQGLFELQDGVEGVGSVPPCRVLLRAAGLTGAGQEWRIARRLCRHLRRRARRRSPPDEGLPCSQMPWLAAA